MSFSGNTSDLYRESFKYFKNYVHSSASQAPQRSNRKAKCRKVNQRSSCCGTSGEGDSFGVEGCTTSNLMTGQGILLPHPQDEKDRMEESIVQRRIGYEPGCKCYQVWGLKSPETWDVMELTFPSGLILIRNPFTSAGQRYWISRTLLDFPHHPEYITNMDNLNRLEKKNRGEPVNNLKDFKLDTCGRNFYEKLRWITFGYHHDWDTKVYSEERRSNFPEDLADMTRYISQILGFSDFEAEAAIANYYHMDSTLSGHVDQSEVNQWAPLFSLSFGQSAIFLIGGKTKSERPQPVLLQSGDIAVMSGESRLSYHGVPKILPASSKSWDKDVLEAQGGNTANDSYNDQDADNLCKRQRLDNDFNDKNCDDEPAYSCFHNCTSSSSTIKDSKMHSRLENVVWNNFLDNYINKSRINLNIRQVLFPGQSDLYSNNHANHAKAQ